MAFLYRQPRSKWWWIRYRDPDSGQIVRRSTEYRHGSPAETRKARALAHEWSARELSAATRRLPASRWDAWVPGFLDAHYRAGTETHRRVCTAWASVREFFRTQSLHEPRAVRREHLLAYVAQRTRPAVGRKVSITTAVMELKCVSVVLGEAVRRAWIEHNPAFRLGIRRPPPPVKPEFTDADLAEIAGCIELEPEPKRSILRTSFLIARWQGCRLRETHLNPMEDVDLEAGIIRFRAKGGRLHAAPLHPELFPLFRELRAQGATQTYPLPPGPTGLSNLWWKFMAGMGLKRRKPGSCFHSLRVTAATRLARAHVPEAKAMLFLGHSTTTVHRVYQRLVLDDLQPCLEALRTSTTGSPSETAASAPRPNCSRSRPQPGPAA